MFKEKFMAWWREGWETVRSDNNRTGGIGVMEKYGADTDADIAFLPQFDGQNQGSSCLTLTGNLYKLGTNPVAGTNGWVML